MKSKIILVVLLVSAISFKGFSQAQFALGLKAGLNLPKLDFKSNVATNVDSRTGFHAGAFALIKITAFAIQPEVLFSKQGSKFTFNARDYEANFDYIAVPVMFKFYLPLGLNLQAGPQFAFASVKDIKQTVQGSSQDVAANFKKKNDTLIALGAGWDLPFNLTIDARYVFGVKDMTIKPDGQSGEASFKNKLVMVSLGYKLIKLGK